MNSVKNSLLFTFEVGMAIGGIHGEHKKVGCISL